MDDTVEVVTHDSFGGRLKTSVQGIIMGFLLLGGGIYLLQWNEGRSVGRYRAIQEGKGAVIEVDAFESIKSSNDGKLIHFSGKTVVNGNVTDDLFGIGGNDLKVRRVVEMYQWKEHKKKTTEKTVGGGTKTTTKYTYSKGWSTFLSESAKFQKTTGHENPIGFPIETKTFEASSANVGHFKLGPDMISNFNWFSKIDVETDSITNDNFKSKSQKYDEGFFVQGDFTTTRYVIKGTPTNPQVGDMIVIFAVVPETEVSIIAKQTKDTVAPYSTSNGKTLFLQMKGNHTAEEMFAQAEESNKILSWVLRGVGFVVLFCSFKLVAEPLNVVVDCIPFLGDLLEAGIDILAGILALIISAIVIAIAWVAYRPMFAFGLLIFIIAVITAGNVCCKKSKPYESASVKYETPGSYQQVEVADAYPVVDAYPDGDKKWKKEYVV